MYAGDWKKYTLGGDSELSEIKMKEFLMRANCTKYTSRAFVCDSNRRAHRQNSNELHGAVGSAFNIA